MKLQSARSTFARHSTSKAGATRKWLLLGAMLAVVALPFSVQAAWVVNSTGDGGNVSISGCNDGTGHCTLRAAINISNYSAGADTITFNLPAGSVIDLLTALPDINTSLSILGPGADKLAIRRSSANGTPEFGIFRVAVASPNVVSISGLTIADGFGAGVWNANSGRVDLTGCTLKNNVRGIGGGDKQGTLSVTTCTISENANSGIYNDNGTVFVTNSTISGNAGTGIYNYSGTAFVTNSTVSNNRESGLFALAGGIYNRGTLTVTNCTITGNSAEPGGNGYGGGIGTTGGSATVKGSLIAGNRASNGPDVAGYFTSGGFNLIGETDGTTGFTAATDQTGTPASPLDPKLDPSGLQDNGGPTQTIALRSDSPAINAGDQNSAPTRDQRGFVRAGIADIGAFEFGGTWPAILANLSTRLRVENGDNSLIGGFIVTGSQPKRLIVRAIGPSLPLSGKLADPKLEVYNASGQRIAANDNWRSTQEAEINATGVAPSHDLEAAATGVVDPGSYTVVVSGANGGTGIGLVEVYDLDRTVPAKLGNIATRGLVRGGDNVMIGGFIVLGADSQKVIVRGIGPSLPFGNKLPDPVLELHDGNGGTIAANDNWKSDQRAEIEATQIAPGNDLESAVVKTLAPGNYTAIVKSANSTVGVAVVEVYALD